MDVHAAEPGRLKDRLLEDFRSGYGDDAVRCQQLHARDELLVVHRPGRNQRDTYPLSESRDRVTLQFTTDHPSQEPRKARCPVEREHSPGRCKAGLVEWILNGDTDN